MEAKELTGLCVCPGSVVGRAHIVSNPRTHTKATDNEIVILEYSEPAYAIEVMQASGVICEKGGRLSHICTIAMEMGIPCVTQVNDILKEVSEGMFISLDATNGKIYIFDEEKGED